MNYYEMKKRIRNQAISMYNDFVKQNGDCYADDFDKISKTLQLQHGVGKKVIKEAFELHNIEYLEK